MFIKQNKVLDDSTTKNKASDKNNLNETQVTKNTSQPLKDRFLTAVANAEIGRVENAGVIVTLKEFKAHFNDIKSDYINSFLPAATIEAGQHSVTTTKYVFRVKKDVYLVHPDVLMRYQS